ncbi:Ig heavy chain Mem5-like [Haemorhous mexicanus]|uniref:Ig heavy chain Mem5-like n=1 Tax=Haemorhous mexicanus TaxID=30427 RepID=UPI0028BE4952|nr:Ig heavy chain Mem5-like [Haemorhous mexicanus]
MLAGPGPGLLALALALWPAGLWAQPRLQEAGGGQRAPGDSVTLSCRGSGFTFEDRSIWWYRQAPGGSPEWVSYISYSRVTAVDYGAAVKGRAEVSRDNSRSEAYLSLRSLQAQDSARYFCALPRAQEIVWTKKLIFGPGTTLTVLPNISKTSDPEVIVMKSKKLEGGGSSGNAACLARNSPTKNISLEMPSQEVVYEQGTSILTSEGLYSAIKVVRVTEDTEVTCTAQFDNRTITAQPVEEAEEPVTGFGEPNRTRTESGASDRVCNNTEPSAQDAGGQRVNMLSMAVLGLRVLLAKSIAFNALMSIKLFLF